MTGLDREDMTANMPGYDKEGKEEPEANPPPDAGLSEAAEKYVRLYAEFENYKKRTQKDKDELIKYANESLLYELLTVIDNLEMALKHSDHNTSDGLVKGVEITLREFQRVLEKFGVTPIYALGKPFDPALHHAMSQVERTDVEDQTIVEEMRKGYMLVDKILRASMVSVSKKTGIKTSETINEESEEEQKWEKQ